MPTVNDTPSLLVRLRSPRAQRVLNWAAVIVWAGIIFYLSSLSDIGLRPKTVLVRKLAHVTEYAVLTILLIRALTVQGLATRRAVWIAVVVALAYAVTDEYHQGFVARRHASPRDVLIDAIGIGAAAITVFGRTRSAPS